MDKWIVMQWGYAVFGCGLTPEEAVTDAKIWLDKDAPQQSWTVADFKSPHTALNGEFVLCRVEDYIKNTEMESQSLVVFFDNGGGITIQTQTYCHHYLGQPKQAANDVAAILNGDSTDHWDGNEPQHRLEEAEVQHDLAEILRIKSKPFDKHNHSGFAETEFYQTLLN